MSDTHSHNNVLAPKTIVMANHLDNANRWVRHPFIILGIYQQKALGLQFSSIKRDKGQTISYFDRMIKNLDDDWGINDVYVRNRSFDAMLEEFFDDDNYPVVEVDEDDGFAFWSRASLKDLYLFDLHDSLIYDFDIKSEISDSKHHEIMRLANEFTWDNIYVQKIIDYYNNQEKSL